MNVSPLRIVFWLTTGAMVAVVLWLGLAAVYGAMGHIDHFRNSWIASIVNPAMTVWLTGAGILWLYGFVVLGRGWASRTAAKNMTLLFVLLFLGMFISPLFYWKRKTL